MNRCLLTALQSEQKIMIARLIYNSYIVLVKKSGSIDHKKFALAYSDFLNQGLRGARRRCVQSGMASIAHLF